MNELYVKDVSEWRNWLENYSNAEKGIWLIFYKKGFGEQTLQYEEAVEEALCFGWIDSIIKKIDEQKYVRKFTPRKENSKWSALNKKRVAKVIREKRMTGAGIKLVKKAKENGMWDQPDRPQFDLTAPDEFLSAVGKNKKARQTFNALAPSYQQQYVGWISVAKREETRNKRIREAISLLEKGEKLGMK